MKKNIEELIRKYQDVLPYLIFGVLTTVVNIISYWFMAHLLYLGVMVSTVIAWILSVLFAYITNRTWVFHSKTRGTQEIFREIVSFFSCRLATGVIDWGCMLVFVDVLGWWDLGVKVAANITVIVLNYLASKLLIFKH